MRFQLQFALLALIQFLLPASAQQQPDVVFSLQPNAEPYYVRPGERNLVLPCTVADDRYTKPPYTLYWIRTFDDQPRIIANGYSVKQTGYELNTTCGGNAGDGGNRCYNLHVKQVSYEQDNAKFVCQIDGPDNFQQSSQSAQVIVLVPPATAVISSQPSQPVRENTAIRLECKSSGGNPPPAITWFFANGSEISTSTTLSKQQTNATEISSFTVGTLQMMVTPYENGAIILCRVWNDALGDESKALEAATSQLNVLYSPRVTVGPASPYNVEIGSLVSILCLADSNPPPSNFTWVFNSQRRNGFQNLTFVAAKLHNGIYYCDVYSPSGYGQGKLQLNVLYGPEIDLKDEYHATLNKQVTLHCAVDSNPPPVSVNWTGPNGEYVSNNNVLEIKSVTLKDAGNYTCSATNELNLYQNGGLPSTRTTIRSTVLAVEHAPGKGVIVPPSQPIIVGATANLTCIAEDPGSPPAKYRWRIPGQSDFDPSTPTLNRPVLTIENAQMSYSGDYFCQPYNEIGLGDVGSYYLTIYIPAQIDQLVKTNDSKNEGDRDYLLTCSAMAHPAPNITWRKDGETIPEDSERWAVKQYFDNGGGNSNNNNNCQNNVTCLTKVVSVLQWKSEMKWNDKGAYECVAYNGAGTPARSEGMLRVSHKPVIINDPSRPFVGVDVKELAVVTCRASAKPDPMFHWYRDGVEIPPNTAGVANNNNIEIDQRHLGDVEDVFESRLIIRSVQDQNLGDYLCKAQNHLGENTFKFTVQLKTKPMLPTDLRTVEATFRSVKIGWVPGFDGGDLQTFVIEVVFPDGTVRMENVTDISISQLPQKQQLRIKRFVGIEKSATMTYNVSDLIPSSEYKFRLKSFNRLGETDWTSPISAWTDNAPLDSTIQKPSEGVYNTDQMTLDFKPTNLDASVYCLLLYRQLSSGKFSVQGCFPTLGTVQNLKPSNNFKIRFCLRHSYVCGEELDVLTGAQSPITWEIVVAIVVSVTFLTLAAAVIFIYCYRSRRTTDKKSPQLSTSSSIIGRVMSPQQKDGENNNNNRASLSSRQDAQVVSSVPDGNNRTSGGTGVGSSNKDSGIFGSTSNNYLASSSYDNSNKRYSATADNNSSSNGSVARYMGGGVGGSGNLNGNGIPSLNRTPSYDDQEHWGATDGYGLTNMSPGGGSMAMTDNGGATALRDYPMKGAATNSMTSSPMYDSYAAAGGGGGNTTTLDKNQSSADPMNEAASSTNSGFSTPNGRRVLKEIIV